MVMQTESKNLMSNLMPKLVFKKHVTHSSPQTKRQAPSPPVQQLSISVDKFDQQQQQQQQPQMSLFSGSSSTSSTNYKKTLTSASSTSSREKNKSSLGSVSSPCSTGSSESVVISSSSCSPKTRKFFNNLAFENNANDYFEEILIDESCDHREMAIDCPDTFVPEFKTKPCYPPPQPQPNVQNKLLTFINQSYSSLQFIDEESRSKLNVTDSPVSESGKSSAGKLLFEKQKDGLVNSAFVIEEESCASSSSSSSSRSCSSRERVPTPKPTETKLELVEIQQEQEKTNEQLDMLVRSFDNHHQLDEPTELDNTLGLYNKFISLCAKYDFRPASDNVTHLITDAMKLLDSFRSSGDAHCEHDELTHLLATIKHIAQAHDQSAVLYNERKLKQQDQNKTLAIQFKEFEHNLTTETEIIEDESLISDEGKYLLTKAEHYSVDNLKLVNIEKTSAPLGATIRSKDGNIVISRIVMGGAAHQSGLLHEDDQILEINNLPVRGKTINDICHLLANLTGIISFLIIPNMSYEPLELDECPARPLKLKDNTLHVRALFSYAPHEDLYLPCKELGLAFNKGDILHVINDDDAQWWQAYKQGDEQSVGTSLAGLVPSQQFQQKRNEQLECIVGDSFMDRKKRGFCYRKHMKNPRRKFMALADEQLTYEEMALYKCERKRPIILIGPHSIGRHELRKRLMQTYPSMFEVAVPHTTRPPRKEEINGKDYHFLPKHIFEVDIKQARFIEHGEFEKNLYGTSYESIRKVIQNDKVCVLNLYPQALKALKCSDLIPYVVYIGPPSLARLREIKSSMNETFKDSDLLDIIDKGREIEELYAHYFDKTIRMCDMNETFEQLYETICRVQNEPTWVPLSWIEKN